MKTNNSTKLLILVSLLIMGFAGTGILAYFKDNIYLLIPVFWLLTGIMLYLGYELHLIFTQ